MKKRNFTLIELLVVIAIIAILASMLLPALNRARDTAKSIACVNKEKQLGLGMAMYQDAYDEYFVPTYPYSGGWPQLFIDEKYVSNLGFFSCPGNTNKKPSDPNPGNSNKPYGTTYSHYGLNQYHIGSSIRYSTVTPDKYAPAKLSRIKHPSKVIIILDSRLGGSTSLSRYNVIDSNGTSASYGYAYPCHSNSLNILWGDGHVDKTKAQNQTEAYSVLGTYSNTGSQWKRQ